MIEGVNGSVDAERIPGRYIDIILRKPNGAYEAEMRVSLSPEDAQEFASDIVTRVMEIEGAASILHRILGSMSEVLPGPVEDEL